MPMSIKCVVQLSEIVRAGIRRFTEAGKTILEVIFNGTVTGAACRAET